MKPVVVLRYNYAPVGNSFPEENGVTKGSIVIPLEKFLNKSLRRLYQDAYEAVLHIPYNDNGLQEYFFALSVEFDSTPKKIVMYISDCIPGPWCPECMGCEEEWYE